MRPAPSSGSVAWVGDWHSPADDLYADLAEEFHARGVSSLRFRYRDANDLERSVEETLSSV